MTIGGDGAFPSPRIFALRQQFKNCWRRQLYASFSHPLKKITLRFKRRQGIRRFHRRMHRMIQKLTGLFIPSWSQAAATYHLAPFFSEKMSSGNLDHLAQVKFFLPAK